MNHKFEENVIISITALKRIMALFLGPFLTAYFIKTSQESIIDLSVYYIFSYFLLAIGTFIVASIVKRKFRLEMFRIGVIVNFIYIFTIIMLKEQIINYLPLLSILYGISASSYYFPYNLFVVNKIDNKNRTAYSVKSKVVISIVDVVFPIILGSMISITNYQMTAVIILFISLIQIVLSFLLTPEKTNDLPKFDLIRAWKKIKKKSQIRKTLLVEFLVGLNIGSGALEVLRTILILNSFKTDFNLGIITSVTTIISIVFAHLYGKTYKNQTDKHIIIFSSIIPFLAMVAFLLWENGITVIIYNVCYVIFTAIISLTREIRLYNVSSVDVVGEDNQGEFFAIREAILNLGRICGYVLLLIAGISRSVKALNLVLVLLTISILMMGLNIYKIKKFDNAKK